MKKITLIIGGMIISLNTFSQLSLNGLRFNGGSQEAVTVPNYFNTIDTGNFTIEAWIRDEAADPGFPTEEPILDNRENSPGPDFGFRFAINDGNLVFFAGTGGIGIGGADLRDSICHHVAITRNSGFLYFYVDGQLKGNIFNNSSLNSNAPALYIGGKDNLSGGVWSFNGLIKEIRIWNVTRTQSEIQTNMGIVLSPNLNLISYWRCNEGSGQTVQDYSGNANNGFSNAGWSTGCPGCLLPSASITPAGSTTFCAPGSVTLNANTGAGLLYQWKKNGINIPGATLSGYITTSSGSYTVGVTNTCGTSQSSPVSVIVNQLPSATITPAGSLTFCSGGNVILNVPTGTNKTYQWKKGANIIPGATLSSYTATTGGNYRVIVTNTVTGCSKTTATPTTVTVNPSPPATITPQGPTTFCTGGSVLLKGNYGAGFAYQWKKGGNDISGATAKDYTATIAGTYKIKVTNSYGCAKLSTGVTVTVPCRENESVETGEEESAFDVKVFPNPAHAEINIAISQEDNFEIEIVNMVGERLIKKQNQSTIDLSGFSSGVYFLNVRSNGVNFTRKIVKIVKN